LSDNKTSSPYAATLKGRCPACGEGRLYADILKLNTRCDQCELDLGKYDQADGPAFFSMFFVGIIVVVPAVWLEMAFSPPLWVHGLIWLPWAVLWTLIFLRLIKSLLVAAQYANKAEEAKLDG